MSATQQQQSSPVAQDEHAGSHGQASGPDLTRASTEQGAAEMEAAAGGASGGTIARLRQNFNVAGVSLFLQILRVGGWGCGAKVSHQVHAKTAILGKPARPAYQRPVCVV
jgi:hypothetical protein